MSIRAVSASTFDYPYYSSALKNNTSALKNSITATHSNSSIVQAYAAAMLSHSPVKLDRIKILEKTQKDMRERVDYLMDDLLPNINATYTSVSAFCNAVAIYGKDALKVAHRIIENPNDQARQELQTILNKIITSITRHQTKIEHLTGSLASYRKLLTTDSHNFQTIIKEADSIYTGDQGLLPQYEKTLATLSKAIDNNIKQLVIGALQIAGGAIMIVLGLVGTLATFGANVKLFVVGVVTTVSGVAMTADAKVNLDKNRKEYAKTFNEIERIKGEAKLLLNIKDHFTAYAVNTANVIDVIGKVYTIWTNLGNNLNNLADSAKNIDLKDEYLASELEIFLEDSADTKQVAMAAQTNGTLAIKLDADLANSLRIKKVFYSLESLATSTNRAFNKAPWNLSLPEYRDLVRAS